MRYQRTSAREEDGPWLPEQLILEQLRASGQCTVEEMLERVPELTWGQLFLAMDVLSRRGEVELSREGFTYCLRMRPGRVAVGRHGETEGPDHR